MATKKIPARNAAKRAIPAKKATPESKKETGWLKIILILLVVAAVLAGLLYEVSLIFDDVFTDYTVLQYEGRYRELAQNCGDSDTTSCCLSSVDAIRTRHYNLTNESLENGCAEGYVKNQLRCVGSYSWCEPVKKGWFG